MKFISFLLIFSHLIVNNHILATAFFFDISQQDSLKSYSFSYRINQPDATFALDDCLNEISGIGISADGKHLIGVQDENGQLFFINKTTGKIDKKLNFYNDGDYEDVAIVDGEIFVLKSSGTLYQIADCNADSIICTKYKTLLAKENDVEGLTYDPLNNRLLLACKGDSGIGQDIDLQKSIYAFNLNKKQMEQKPAFTINQASIFNFLNTHPAIEKLENLMMSFAPSNRHLEFCPSAIAIHPLSGEIYVLASIGKMLVVLNPSGEVVHIEKLDKKVHRQPEGMAFDNDGTLYISNESNEDKPKIYRFS